MAEKIKPAVIEKQDIMSSKEMCRIDGQILEQWQKAVERFRRSNVFTGQQKENADRLSKPNIESWLSEFKESRHRDTRFRNICKTVSQHFYIIQIGFRVVELGSNIASSISPAASPVSLVVNALAFLFGSLVKVSNDFDKIELFFRKIANTIRHLQNLDGRLHLPETQPLQEYIVEVFVRSLDICRIGLQQTEKRFKKWFEKMVGDDELDAAFNKMQEAEQEFRKAINVVQLAMVTDMGGGFSRKKFQEILNWISSGDDFHKIYTGLLNGVKYNPNAGQWLLQSEKYRKWRDYDCNMLWYTGAPGAGKSVMTSIIIKDLLNLPSQTNESSKNPAIGYVFLSYKKPSDLDILLGIIVRQVQSTCDLHREIEKRFDGCYDGRHKLGQEELLDFLSLLIQGRRFYIVVDAMDECPWDLRKPLLNCLMNIKSDNAVVKIFITSRFMENIFEYQKPFITDEIKANCNDVDDYIDHIIDEYPKYLQDFREFIHKVVRERSRDMFIIVRLHMEALVHVQLKAQVRPTLDKLPKTLDGTYESAFQRIQQKEKQSKDIAELVIALVSYAIDPLSIRELRHALATIMTINRDELFDEDGMVEEDDIITYCCGLIVVDIDRDVRFVHRSAQEYFQKMKKHLFPDFDYQMALTCTEYLTLCATSGPEDFKIQIRSADRINEGKKIERPITGKLKDFPFVVYAGKNLHLHIHRVRHLLEGSNAPGANNKLSEWIHQLVHKTPNREFYSCLLHQFEAYYSESDVLDDRNESIVLNRTTTLGILHMAAFLGSIRLVEEAIKSHDVNEIDCYGQSALVVAFKNNLDDIAEILLDHGATVNLLSKKGHALLLFAAERSYSKLVEKIVGNVPNEGPDGLLKIFGLVLILVGTLLELLVQALNLQAPKIIDPVKPETEDGTKIMDDHSLDDYRRLLSYAYHGQCENLDDLFVDHKIDLQLIEYEDSSRDKPTPYSDLHTSYRRYRYSSSESADSSNHDSHTSYRRYEDNFGHSSGDSSDEDRIKDESNGSESYNEEGNESNNEEGNESNNEEGNESNNEEGNESNNEEDMSIKDTSISPGSDFSSIESAKSESDKDEDSGINEVGNIFQDDITLINEGLNQNAVKALFIKTACFLAIERGQCGSLKTLLQKAIDIDLKNYQGQSLLHRATAANNEEMVTIVLEKKPEVDSRDDNGRTALMAYAGLKRENVLQILLQHGASINLTHIYGSNELFEAAIFGATEVVRFFLKNEVNPSIPNDYGWTPLHGAAANGHLEIVQYLLEAKANHSAISDTGMTPLDCSASGDDHFNGFDHPGEKHYSYVKSQQKNVNPEYLIERRDMIESALRRAGAKTSEELLRHIGEDQFNYGPGGQYTHKGAWFEKYAKDIKRVQGLEWRNYI